MRIKRKLLLSMVVFIIALCTVSMAKAVDEGNRQGFTVTGVVTDAEGLSLPGVNVLLQGTAIGVTTDINGKYSITVTGSESVLVFSYIG